MISQSLLNLPCTFSLPYLIPANEFYEMLLPSHLIPKVYTNRFKFSKGVYARMAADRKKNSLKLQTTDYFECISSVILGFGCRRRAQFPPRGCDT
jgi:hypothetical protein